MSARPSRRVMGHGTIYRRPNGSWAGEITVDGKRSTAYARTQAECVAKLQALQASVAGGLPAVDQHGTVAAYLAGWLETKRPKLRPSTMARYKGIVEAQIIPELGRVKLAKLQPVDVDRMLARLQAQGLSPGRLATSGPCCALPSQPRFVAARWSVTSPRSPSRSESPRCRCGFSRPMRPGDCSELSKLPNSADWRHSPSIVVCARESY